MLSSGQTIFECRKLSTCVSVIQKQTDSVVFYLSVTYFQFQVPLLPAFIACLTEPELLTSDSLIQNFVKE